MREIGYKSKNPDDYRALVYDRLRLPLTDNYLTVLDIVDYELFYDWEPISIYWFTSDDFWSR